MSALIDDATVVQRLLDHIDQRTTDLGQRGWREPVVHYRDAARFAAERERVLRRGPLAFCAAAALPEPGSFVARAAAGTPILVVRGADGGLRAFRNACRHRGTQLADGSGCAKAFVCRYHGWTYGLDGALRHVPHESGFPELDKASRGLAPLPVVERQGVVFVTQEPGPDAWLDTLPPLVPPRFRLLGSVEQDIPANWKILVEGFLEGYHIRTTHPETFYPLQYDNLNVVEHFGRNTRIAFPFRAIEKQRGAAAAARRADGALTYVYHLFPNFMVATFPGRIVTVAIEPLAVDQTRYVISLLTDRDASDAGVQASLGRGADLVNAGGLEDREVACAIQRGLASGANEFFEFGLFEGAIGHFHRALQTALDAG